MIEHTLEIQAGDGHTEAVLFCPDDSGGRWPGVIHYTDIGGVREANRQMAARVAALGYTVLLPNVFYRTSRLPVFDFPRKPGQMDERSLKRMKELMGPLDAEAMHRDGAAYVDFLSSHPNVTTGPVRVVGYCLTGAMALRTAAARPEAVSAAASFHGGGLYSDAPTSPHLVLPLVKARLYFGHADQDKGMPAEAIAKFEAALEAWGGRYESETYAGALHSWTVPDSPVFNEPQAERAFQKLAEMLK